MRVLGLDAATTGCSAALWEDGAIVAARFAEMARGQAERLNPMIGEVMAEAGWPFGSLDRIGVTVGPGAFTGLRVGLAAARALGLAAGVPVAGVTTFAALARAVPGTELAGRSLLVAVNAKRRDVFVQAFDSARRPAGEPGAVAPEAAAAVLPDGAVLLAGDGARTLAAPLGLCAGAADAGGRVRLSTALGPPDAVHVAALAAEPAAPDIAPPRPLYIRPPDARRPRAGGRRRP